MTDNEIKLHLIGIAIKNNTAESLEGLMKNLTDPMFEFFLGEKDIAKIFIVLQMIEDQAIIPTKKKIIEIYRKLNEGHR